MMAMSSIKFQIQLPRCHWSSPESRFPRIANTCFQGKKDGVTSDFPCLSISTCNPSSLRSYNKNLVAGRGKEGNQSRLNVASPNTSVDTSFDILNAYDDEYGGVIIDMESLPSNPYIFAAMLQSSLSSWRMKGKRGIWLRIMANQADLVPIAIEEGFVYHHAEPGYVMLTYWIPEGPCLLPATGSHQVGIGGFVINDNREVLVVKEKTCPSRCSGLWKLPTGFIDKSEEIYLGAIREIKEETGIDTEFLEVVAFRHAHLVAFEKSDLFFICMLKPLTFDIRIDESEIEDAKWMPLEEFIAQPFYNEDFMSRKAIEICTARFEGHYKGFAAHQVISKFDDRLSYLYYKD